MERNSFRPHIYVYLHRIVCQHPQFGILISFSSLFYLFVFYRKSTGLVIINHLLLILHYLYRACLLLNARRNATLSPHVAVKVCWKLATTIVENSQRSTQLRKDRKVGYILLSCGLHILFVDYIDTRTESLLFEPTFMDTAGVKETSHRVVSN